MFIFKVVISKGFLQRPEHGTFCDSGGYTAGARVEAFGVFPALEEVRALLLIVGAVESQAAAADSAEQHP